MDDEKYLEDVMENARNLVEDYRKQKENMAEIDKMFFMDWENKPKEAKDGELYKFTTSPSARDALLGAIRLMTTTEPTFNVPFDKNDEEVKAQSEVIEKICQAIWYHSGRFRGVPLQEPAVENLLRHGMMVLSITDTEDLYENIKAAGTSKAQEYQLKRLMNSTPYIIEVWDPRSVYAEWGRFGLTTVYRQTVLRVSELIQQVGEKLVFEKTPLTYGDMDTLVVYSDYWNLERHISWLSNYRETPFPNIIGKPLLNLKHELPCIPVVVQTSEGSYTETEREHQAVPFLYGLLKSELWERENLVLTTLYTNLFALGTAPTYAYQTADEEAELRPDYSVPGGYIKLSPNESYTPIPKEAINADILKALDISRSGIEESTIFRQALGGIGGLGANSAFSTVALLHQAGRLPLVSPQTRGGWGLGTAMELIFEMMKDKGKNRSIRIPEGSIYNIDIEAIPDNLIIEGKLDVSLPQDMPSQANVAAMLSQTDLASIRWIREKILNIAQSEEMDAEIMTQKAFNQHYQLYLQDLILKSMKEQAMQEAQATPGAQTGQAPAPEQALTPGQMPLRAPLSKLHTSQPGTAFQTQAGLMPAQRPGEQPYPPSPYPRPPQEGTL